MLLGLKWGGNKLQLCGKMVYFSSSLFEIKVLNCSNQSHLPLGEDLSMSFSILRLLSAMTSECELGGEIVLRGLYLYWFDFFMVSLMR